MLIDTNQDIESTHHYGLTYRYSFFFVLSFLFMVCNWAQLCQTALLILLASPASNFMIIATVLSLSLCRASLLLLVHAVDKEKCDSIGCQYELLCSCSSYD